MNPTWIWAILSIAVVSLLSLVGALTLFLSPQALSRFTFVTLSMAVGALMGDAFIHLLPEAYAAGGGSLRPGLLALCGVFGFFVLEKFFHMHHHDMPEEGQVKPLAYVTLLTCAQHNLIDGAAIAIAYQADWRVGLATTAAICFHEIPKELSDFGILLYAGMSRQKALWANFLSGLTALLGGLLALWLGERVAHLGVWVLPLTAGGFIYMAGSDLIPELHKESDRLRSALQFTAIALGVGLMAAVALLE